MVILTGASGWFGKTFMYEYINIHGFERFLDEVTPFTSNGRDIHLLDYVIPSKNFTDLVCYTDADVLVHSAFITRDKITELGDRLYKSENTRITQTVCALIEKSQFKKIFVTSSGVAGLPKEERVKDLYADLKFQEECSIQNLQSKGLHIYRIFGATGKFIPECEWSAISSFITQCKNQKKIIVKARGRVLRSYVSFHDLSKLIMAQISDSGISEIASITDAASVNTDIHEVASIVALLKGVETTRLLEPENFIEHKYMCKTDNFIRFCSDNFIVTESLTKQLKRCVEN